MRKKKQESHILPLVPLRETVPLPFLSDRILIARASSIAAVKAALQQDRHIILALQRNSVDAPTLEDIHPIGVIAYINRVVPRPNGIQQIYIETENRVHLTPHGSDGSLLLVKATICPETQESKVTDQDLDELYRLYQEYASKDESPDKSIEPRNLAKKSALVYYILSTLRTRKYNEVQDILATSSLPKQVAKARELLKTCLAEMSIEKELVEKVASTLHQNARQHFIREQIRALQKELGEDEDSLLASEIERLSQLIAKAGMPEHVLERANEELERLRKTLPLSPEYSVIRTYIEWLTVLPWSTRSEDNLNIAHVHSVLESEHYDLEKPKERILEYISILHMTGSLRGQILCFVGPPGVGKTSLAASIARALGRKFVRISLGGIRDEAEIRGHRRTYIGAMPGRIIQAMKRAGTINPVILLDEVDKLGADFRGDPTAALLEVLDPEQNRAFNDHFLEVDYDLSNVLFIATANVMYDIPLPLLDRMEVIELNSYLDDEKIEIAKRHIIPRLLQRLGLEDIPIEITDEAIMTIIREYTREAGVRNLEREFSSILRKIARQIVQKASTRETDSTTPLRQNPRFRRLVRKRSFVVDRAMVQSLLKAPRFRNSPTDHVDRIGVATGLAWTSTGGDILPVEVTMMAGTERLLLTGKLGDIMKESAQAALSFVRANARLFNIPEDFAKNKDIHIHVPEGAIAKDGPSAGITMTIALISAARGEPVRGDVAMTGEITLRGTILPVGGLNEKLLAAKRHGITNVIVPKDNEHDIQDLPAHLVQGMTIWYVSSIQDALHMVFRNSNTHEQNGTPSDHHVTPYHHA